jgi:hypothetical protein
MVNIVVVVVFAVIVKIQNTQLVMIVIDKNHIKNDIYYIDK